MEQLESWDQALFLFLNGIHADWLDVPMYVMTKSWFWIPVFAFLLYRLYKSSPSLKHYGWILLGIGLCVGASDLISTRVFKMQIKRYRPTHHLVVGPQAHTVNDFNGNEYRGGRYGFLSSHATNYFSIAMFCFLALGRQRKYLWLFIWVGLIAYTRLYLGVHYPSDLFAGALLGMLIGYSLFRGVSTQLQKT